MLFSLNSWLAGNGGGSAGPAAVVGGQLQKQPEVLQLLAEMISFVCTIVIEEYQESMPLFL
jgi:hypothetical protein